MVNIYTIITVCIIVSLIWQSWPT